MSNEKQYWKAKPPTKQQVTRFQRALGRRFKEIREDKGLDRNWVAEKLVLQHSTPASWESGAAFPAPMNMLYLAKLYEVKVADFFRGIN